MMRDSLKDDTFWSQWINHYVYEVDHRRERLGKKFEKESYRPQYAFDLSMTYWVLALHRYSRGDSISELSQYLEPLLHFWEESERLGKASLTPERQQSQRTWSNNLDFYIDSFWLVGLALALDVPDAQWQRLIALIGNEGQDMLLDRIIATRTPSRKIGTTLCYPKPYARLLKAIDGPTHAKRDLLAKFVEHWYRENGSAAKSGREAQAVPYRNPYWYNYHRIEGGYFGFWCLEAVAAVKAFGLDDSKCVGHPNYPGDLLRPGHVTPPDMARLLPELAASIGQPPPKPFTGEPLQLTAWQTLKLLIKNKLDR